MKWSWFGRAAMALTSAVALGLSMTACGGGTIAYLWAVGTTKASGPAGTQNGVVVGYQVDDFTGNLTAIPGQPFGAGGTNPVQVLVRPGGRFVYVINQGTGFTPTSAGTSDAIQLFAVGGSGTLTPEVTYESRGYGHVWAAFDTSGGYLYILDQYSPSGDGNGSITTFSSDPTTGRLSLVSQTSSTQPGQQSPTFLEVGKTPLRMLSTGNCLFTLNSVGQTVSAYSIASGQLGTVTTGTIPVNTVSATSIGGNGQYIFITDSQNRQNAGFISSYTIGSGCSLVPFTGGAKANDPSVVGPVNTFLTTSGKYVYVLNSSSTNTTTTTRGSTVTGYVINAGVLQPLPGSPFSSGAGPTCMVEDPTSKYLYTSDGTDGTITGYLYSDTQGEVAGLSRGSTFQTSAQGGLSCLAISGSI